MRRYFSHAEIVEALQPKPNVTINGVPIYVPPNGWIHVWQAMEREKKGNTVLWPDGVEWVWTP